MDAHCRLRWNVAPLGFYMGLRPGCYNVRHQTGHIWHISWKCVSWRCYYYAGFSEELGCGPQVKTMYFKTAKRGLPSYEHHCTVVLVTGVGPETYDFPLVFWELQLGLHSHSTRCHRSVEACRIPCLAVDLQWLWTSTCCGSRIIKNLEMAVDVKWLWISAGCGPQLAEDLQYSSVCGPP